MSSSLQCVVIGALILFSSLSGFALNSDCQPVISYQSISGNYIDQLGIKNLELEQRLIRLAENNPKYCNMSVEIVYEEGLDPRQLVLKKNGASRKNGYHFQLQFFAPVYVFKIKDKDGFILHDVDFEKELTFSTFKFPNTIIEEKDFLGTNQTNRPEKSNTKNPTPNPRTQPSQNNSPKDAATYTQAYTGLKNLIKFKVCSKDSYSMFNRSYYTFNVEVGNTESTGTKTHFIGADKTLHLSNNLDKKSWFTLHYPLALHQLDMKKYTSALKSIYRDLDIIEKGSEFIQDFIDELPDTYQRNRYDPSKDEMVEEEVDIRVDKFFSGLGVNIYKDAKTKELINQIHFFHGLMARSYLLHYFYLEVKKRGLPKMLLKDLPNVRFKYPKRMTSSVSLRGSTFALYEREGILNEFWGVRTPSYRGIMQLGLPFEKSSGAIRNREYYRPYLVFGYEVLNIPVNDTRTNFVGGGYTNGGDPDQEFQLQTSNGIKLRSHSFQVGAVFKSLLANGIYIDLGGGVRKKWCSQLIFDEGQNYLGNQNLSLLSYKQSDVLESDRINPYFELTIGRDFNDNDKRNCSKDKVRLDVFFSAHIANVHLEPGDNFQLYQSSFENSTLPPFSTPSANNNWYLMISMGIGFNLF